MNINNLIATDGSPLESRLAFRKKGGLEMSRKEIRDARNSTIMRAMADKPPELGIARTEELIVTLDPQEVERICHLGNRIVGSNAGKRFELK